MSTGYNYSSHEKLRYFRHDRAAARESGLVVFGSAAEDVFALTGADCLAAGTYILPTNTGTVIVIPSEVVEVDPDETPASGDEYNTYPPTATIATFTLGMPRTPEPGQTVTLIGGGAITALTMTVAGGHTLKTALTAMATDSVSKWVFFGGIWYRVF